MRLLDGLVARTFLRLFGLSVVAMPLLFIVGDLTDNLDDYLNRELAAAEILLGYVYMLPQFFLWSFPISGLIAGVFTVHGMTTQLEVMAAKAGGISFYRLVAPIVLLGCLITGVAFAMSDLVPWANARAADTMENRRIEREWRSDFAFQSENGYTMAVGRLTLVDNRITNVTMTQETDEGDQIHIEAAGAQWEEGHWLFRDGTWRQISAPGDEFSTRFEYMQVAGLTEAPIDLIQEVRDPDEMTRAQIERQTRIARRAGADVHQLILALHQRWSIAAATLIILLFGIPLATSSKRGGTAYGIGVALGSTILYLVLMKVFGGLGESATIPPEWAAWTPNGVFLLAGLSLLSRVRT